MELVEKIAISIYLQSLGIHAPHLDLNRPYRWLNTEGQQLIGSGSAAAATAKDRPGVAAARARLAVDAALEKQRRQQLHAAKSSPLITATNLSAETGRAKK